MNKLLPCPFCGGKAYIKKWQPFDGYQREGTLYKVVCEDCFACSDKANEIQKVIERWNMRNFKKEGERF